MTLSHLKTLVLTSVVAVALGALAVTSATAGEPGQGDSSQQDSPAQQSSPTQEDSPAQKGGGYQKPSQDLTPPAQQGSPAQQGGGVYQKKTTPSSVVPVKLYRKTKTPVKPKPYAPGKF